MHWIEAHANAAEYERDARVRNAARDAEFARALKSDTRPKAPTPARQPSFLRRLVLGQ